MTKRFLWTIALLAITTMNLWAQRSQTESTTHSPVSTTISEHVDQSSDSPNKNYLFAEIGGNGKHISLQFEHQLGYFGATPYGFRVGAGITTQTFKGDADWLFPIEFYTLLGVPEHRFELGGGIITTLGFEEQEAAHQQILGDNIQVYKMKVEREFASLLATANVGYRYQPFGKNWQVRAGLQPVIPVYKATDQLKPQLWGYVGIGIRLTK